MAKKLSTSALAKKRELTSKELFTQLESASFIKRENDSWTLLESGEKAGGEYATHAKYGQYITWPEDLTIEKSEQQPLVTATAIGKLFELSANRINSIFSELGWIEKALKGWTVTQSGKSVGGVQKEDSRSGVPYVSWPESIARNKSLRATIKELQGESSSKITAIPAEANQNFREKFEAKLRTTDGHYVRSKSEMLIDNWLYMAEIVHAYERKLPIEEEVYCDFYIPTGKVYIEYWSSENDDEYLARKAEKQQIYKKYGFKLIELKDTDVQILDDVLPRLLLKHGIESY
ncbi:MAG: hypothetical protein OQK12_16550 [Motiliproteus sp.]|nr:hypothetical protein [Motiliproteus sp.]MCW9051485.1 hypothetical protein [Motiliproteus sp.]